MNSLCSATICLAVALCPAAGLHAQAATAEHASPSVLNLTVKDLTPKFMQFFDEATRENASPERRWELWKKDYDFAAVPPTAQGEAMAKQMLTEAWPRYPAAIGVIGKGAAGLTPDPHATFQAIAGLLRPSEPVSATSRRRLRDGGQG